MTMSCAVDQHATHNRQVWKKGDLYAWAADDDERPATYVALFNAADGPARATIVTFDLSDLTAPGGGGAPAQSFGDTARNLWRHKDVKLGGKKAISASLLPHQAALFLVPRAPAAAGGK